MKTYGLIWKTVALSLDEEIDQEVYKIYGLTKGKIQIIEESLR